MTIGFKWLWIGLSSTCHGGPNISVSNICMFRSSSGVYRDVLKAVAKLRAHPQLRKQRINTSYQADPECYPSNKYVVNKWRDHTRTIFRWNQLPPRVAFFKIIVSTSFKCINNDRNHSGLHEKAIRSVVRLQWTTPSSEMLSGFLATNTTRVSKPHKTLLH